MLLRGNALVATLLRRQPSDKQSIEHRLAPQERREQCVPTPERGNEKKNRSVRQSRRHLLSIPRVIGTAPQRMPPQRKISKVFE